MTDHPLYWSLGNTPFEREAAYRDLLAQGADSAAAISAPGRSALTQGADPQETRRITEACVRSWALGSSEFLERLSPGSGRRLRPKRRGRPFRKDSDPI